MDSSGLVPSGSNVKAQPVVPRQITIEILGEEGITTNQPVKITSFPVNSSPLKVVDFRQITMKSDVPAGSDLRIASDALRSLVTPAGLAKAKTQLSKAISKDIIVKDRTLEEQRNAALKNLTPRPILPKPSQAEGSVDDGNLPMRIKQVSRIGSAGINEKVNYIEVQNLLQKPVAPVYAPSYTRMSQHHFSSTPSSTNASNSPAVMSTGARRGRKKHSKKVYYAYVTESESDHEMRGGFDRRIKKKRKREHDVVDDRAVLSTRRSKRENLSQKLVEWGLLPGERSRGPGPEIEEYDDEAIMPPIIHEAPVPQPLMKRSRMDEEEDLEPVIPGPPPKFVRVSNASTAISDINDLDLQGFTATAMETRVPEGLMTLNQYQPQPSISQQMEAINLPVKLPVRPHKPTVRELQIQLEEAIRAEANEQLLQAAALKTESVEGDSRNNLAQIHQAPVALPASGPLMVSTAGGTGVPAILGPVSITPASPRSAGHPGWIKKASSMYAPPMATSHSPAPFLPKKRVDTMNKSLMCKPIMLTKATVCNPNKMHKQVQTDENVVEHKRTVAIPLPVPQFIPFPGFAMSMPTLAPLPIPMVVPVPLPLPATKKNVRELISKLKELQNEASRDIDPLESELLDIAEVISETKTQEDLELETYNASIIRGVNDQNYVYPGTTLPSTGRMNGGAGNEDVLEMAMRMAADMPEDPNNVTGSVNRAHVPGSMESSRSEMAIAAMHSGRTPAKQPLPVNDSNVTLKYSYSLKAWKYWADKKNEELSKMGRSRFQFPTDPLACESDTLNHALSYFVKDLTKPTGESYSPDTIVHFCLGIQYYLKENGHHDNIFFDFPYQKFTDTLNELLAAYDLKLNSQNIVICRVTEEHMWESSQLGCFSPQTLLNTLIYFNTKHFLLDTVQAHASLSFSAIDRSKENQVRKLSLKRAIQGREIKLSSEEHLKHYENIDDPLRCPVKIFEFYLSKCPESVRDSTKLFYLNPDPKAKPNSPYWYSPFALSAGAITKMLNRTKVVREVRITKLEHMQI